MAGSPSPGTAPPGGIMRDEEILTHIEMSHRDEAATPEEAIARMRVRFLKALVREHLSRSEWNERQATLYENELDKLLEKYGWVDSPDAVDDQDDDGCSEF